MCLAGIEAEMAALVARKQAAEVTEVNSKTIPAQPELRKRIEKRKTADRTISTLRGQSAIT